MNILLTNDDGINSIGLFKLKEILKKYGTVYRGAPSVEQSGKACSISAFKGVRINKIDEFNIAVDGTPVDCVEVAYSMLNVKFDLVVSGCNNGYNLSNDIMYSGTCGACIQALMAKIPAIAFSCKNKDYFYMIDEYVPEILQYIFSKNLIDNKYFLNVNIPEKVTNNIMITKVYEPVYESYYSSELNEDGTYIIYRNKISIDNNFDSDINAISNGFISITPLSQTIFKNKYYSEIIDKLNK